MDDTFGTVAIGWRWLLICLASAATFIVLPNRSDAHPHASIKMETAFIMNDVHAITALRLEWTLDDEYSATIAERDVERFAATSIQNLKEYGYFVDLRVDGAQARGGDPVEYASERRNGNLVLSFTLPLLSSVSVQAHTVALSIYDPTYFIDMYHGSGDAVTFSGLTSANCSAELTQPQPSQNLVDFAAALDRAETAPAFLGRSFAEVITITCH